MAEKSVAPKVGRGRPTKYTQELADKIVALVASGKSERSICQSEDMPSTVTLWAWKNADSDFLNRLSNARRESSEVFDDLALETTQELFEAAQEARQMNLALPGGYVDAMKFVIQQRNHQAAMRDDSRFGDRKKIKVETDTKTLSTGMKEAYASIRNAIAQLDAEK